MSGIADIQRRGIILGIIARWANVTTEPGKSLFCHLWAAPQRSKCQERSVEVQRPENQGAVCEIPA